MKLHLNLNASLILLFFVLLLANNISAQCIYNGPEPDDVLSPNCTSQNTSALGNGVGAGAYRFYSGFSGGTWYYFNLENTAGNLTCASANFADASKTTVGLWNNILGTTAYMLASATTNYVWVQTASNGTWSSTSSLLTYGVAVPSTPVWNANPSNVCSSTGTVYSVNTVDYATEYVWSISGGIGYLNGNVGVTTLTTTTNNVTVTFTGVSSSDSITVYATNNGVCSSAPISTYINSFISPTISVDSNAVMCAGNAASISVSFSGGGSPQFQWQLSDNGNWINVIDGIPASTTYIGSTSTSLNILSSPSTPSNSYSYQCVLVQSGCASNAVTITTNPIFNDTIYQTICEGQLAEGYAVTGIFTDLFVSVNGCDSTRTLDLTVLPRVNGSVTQTICEGASFEGYSTSGTFVDTLANAAANGCDSIRTLDLTVLPRANGSVTQTICEGSSFEGYSTSGTFVDTLANAAANGCDSIRTLDLTVLPRANGTVTQTICEGSSFEGYSTSGTFVDTFTNAAANGCDSIRTLDLTVLPRANGTVTQTICEGSSFEGYSTSGTFVDTFANAAENGCDSIRTLNLTVLQGVNSTVTQTICDGETFEGYSTSGTFVDTFANAGANGCDSIRTLILTVLPIATSSISQTICDGESFEGYSTSGTFVDTFANAGANGCDSIRTLLLSVLPSVTSSISQTICDGETFEGYSTNGTFTDTYANAAANGCDSIRTLILTVLPIATSSISQTICDGETFEGYSTSGTFVDTFANAGANGCDSIRTLNLTVSPLPAVPTITQSGNTLTSSAAAQYQWYLNGNLLVGETNQTLVITTNGSYTVEVTDGSSCSNTSAPFNAIFNSISHIAEARLVNIYPNPTTDVLNLQFSNLTNSEALSLRIFNDVGQQIEEKTIIIKSTSFSLIQSFKDFGAGVYLLQLQQGSWTHCQRIMKSN